MFERPISYMKKLVLVFFVLLTVSCTERKSYVSVAEGYCTNLFKHKVSELTKYATESTVAKARINVTRGTYKLIPDYKFQYLSDSVSGNRAWVTFSNPSGTESTLPLIKIEGTWKVHFD